MLLFAFGVPVQAHGKEYSGGEDYEERKFEEERLKEFRADPEMDYERKTGISLWERIRDAFASLFDWDTQPPRSANLSAPTIGVFWNVLLWVLIGVLASFLIMQLMRVDWRKLVRKESDDGNLEYEIKEDEIEGIDFNTLIAEAVDSGRYRTAVRLHYLRSLKALQDKQMIKWRSEKTNYEYLQELNPGPIRKVFTDLTRLFEYIWYGEFPIDRIGYNEAKDSFESFEKDVEGTGE